MAVMRQEMRNTICKPTIRVTSAAKAEAALRPGRRYILVDANSSESSFW